MSWDKKRGRATEETSLEDSGPLPERWMSRRGGVSTGMDEKRSAPQRLVHLELHTRDQVAASAFYARLLSWTTEAIETLSGSYLALELGCGVHGGIVECGIRQPLWLPYVEVDRIEEHTAYAQGLGARVLLEPREGPTGWRSVISTREGGQIAFWQPKR